jgi:excisionase family DNA binding protein
MPRNPIPESPYYTTQETAAYLRVSERTVLEMVKRGDLREIRIGRRHRIFKESVHGLEGGVR